MYTPTIIIGSILFVILGFTAYFTVAKIQKKIPEGMNLKNAIIRGKLSRYESGFVYFWIVFQNLLLILFAIFFAGVLFYDFSILIKVGSFLLLLGMIWLGRNAIRAFRQKKWKIFFMQSG